MANPRIYLDYEEAKYLLSKINNDAGWFRLKLKLHDVLDKTSNTKVSRTKVVSASSYLDSIEKLDTNNLLSQDDLVCASLENKAMNDEPITNEEAEFYLKVKGYSIV